MNNTKQKEISELPPIKMSGFGIVTESRVRGC